MVPFAFSVLDGGIALRSLPTFWLAASAFPLSTSTGTSIHRSCSAGSAGATHPE